MCIAKRKERLCEIQSSLNSLNLMLMLKLSNNNDTCLEYLLS